MSNKKNPGPDNSGRQASLKLSRNTIFRLHQYRKSLYRLKRLGFTRVFSDNLADAVSVTSSQVRKDFSDFGLSGNRRGGYNADELIAVLDRRLDKDRVQNVVVAGAGNLGRALVHYKGFEREQIRILAVFDSDPAKTDRKARVPVLPSGEMGAFIHKHKVQAGIIAVPDTQAQSVLDQMVRSGVRGILNFAPIRLSAHHEDLVINQVDLGLELETVLYLVNHCPAKGGTRV